MHFNRCDICEAYYLFASHWHGGQFSKEYRILGRLKKINFIAHNSLSTDTMSVNGREIYDALVRKLGKGPADYETCGECGYDHSYEYEEAHKAHQNTVVPGHTCSDF